MIFVLQCDDVWKEFTGELDAVLHQYNLLKCDLFVSTMIDDLLFCKTMLFEKNSKENLLIFSVNVTV